MVIPSPPDAQRILVHLQFISAIFNALLYRPAGGAQLRQLSQYAQALDLIQEALALPGLADDEEYAFLLYQQAWIAFLRADYAEARSWATASLERYRALGQSIGIADSLAMLGWTAYEMGRFAEAEALCREAQAVGEQADYAWGVQYAIYGLVWRARGDYTAARQCFLQNLNFCEEIAIPGGWPRHTSTWGWWHWPRAT